MLVNDQQFLVSIGATIVADVWGIYQLDIALNHYKQRLTVGDTVGILAVETGGVMLLEVTNDWRDSWEG